MDEYLVVNEGAQKRVVPVRQVAQPMLVDPLTAIVLGPLYVLQAVLMLPILTMISISNILASQQIAVPQYPKMVITEVVRDEQGRITQVIERVI